MFLKENFGYDKYPGNCHIIPNAGVIILSLLYGEDSFDKTLQIAAMCGWDTDCNVGNLGTIMGVRKGLAGIDCEKWRKPVNDLLICSSVMGTMNITDIPQGALYFARMAFEMEGTALPEFWNNLSGEKGCKLHFEYPGSTHAMRGRRKMGGCSAFEEAVYLENSSVRSCTGKRSLKIKTDHISPGEEVFIYQKTHYIKKDLYDNRYEPEFSPLIYPGQVLRGRILIPNEGEECCVCMYVKEHYTGNIIYGPKQLCTKEKWMEMKYNIPHMDGAILEEAGFVFLVSDRARGERPLLAYVDEMDYMGHADYSIDFVKAGLESADSGLHEVQQFTRPKGWTWLESGEMHLLCADYGETYTGSHTFEDYSVEATVKPLAGMHHRINVRVQGAMRSYAVGLDGKNRLSLFKNEKGYRRLVSIPFHWEMNQDYWLKVTVSGNEIVIFGKGGEMLRYRDEEKPYLSGAFGFSAEGGSHSSWKNVKVY